MENNLGMIATNHSYKTFLKHNNLFHLTELLNHAILQCNIR